MKYLRPLFTVFLSFNLCSQVVASGLTLFIDRSTEEFFLSGSANGEFEYDYENNPPSYQKVIGWEYDDDIERSFVDSYELTFNASELVTLSHSDENFNGELSYTDNTYIAAWTHQEAYPYRTILFEFQLGFDWGSSDSPPSNLLLSGAGQRISYNSMPEGSKLLFESMIGKETNTLVDGVNFGQVTILEYELNSDANALINPITSIEEFNGYTVIPNPLLDPDYENDDNAIIGFYDSIIYTRGNDGEWGADKLISYSYNPDTFTGTLYVDSGDYDIIEESGDYYRKIRLDMQFLADQNVEYTYYYVLDNGNEIRLNYPDGSPFIIDGILENTGFSLDDLPVNQSVSDFPNSQNYGFDPNIWGTSHSLEDSSGEVNSLLSFDSGWEVEMESINNNRFHLEMIGADYRTIGFGFVNGYGLDSAFVFEIYTEGTNQSDEIRKLLFDYSSSLGENYFLKVIFNPYTNLLSGYYRFSNDLSYNEAFTFNLDSGEITFEDDSIVNVSSWLNLSENPKFIQPGLSSGALVPFLLTKDEIVSFEVIIDSDSDGVPNALDAFPDDPNESIDTDQDGIGNNADTDDDNDGYLDDNDTFPLDSSEWLDTDSDGIGNNADTDDDNDLLLDLKESQLGSDPLIADNFESLIPIINQFDLTSEIQSLRPGSTIIEIQDGQATLTMEVEQSDDLGIWTTGGASTLQIPIQAGEGKKFFRFKLAE